MRTLSPAAESFLADFQIYIFGAAFVGRVPKIPEGNADWAAEYSCAAVAWLELEMIREDPLYPGCGPFIAFVDEEPCALGAPDKKEEPRCMEPTSKASSTGRRKPSKRSSGR